MIPFFLGVFAKLRKVNISFVVSVRPSFRMSVHLQKLVSHWMYFLKFDISGFFENMSRKLNFYKKVTWIRGTLHEDQYTFLIISHSLLHRMRNIWDKIVEKIKTHILWSILFPPPPPENRTFYEICGKKYGRRVHATGDSIIRRMRFACWLPKATDIHPEHVIVIDIPVQRLLHELSTVLRNAYVALFFSVMDRSFIC